MALKVELKPGERIVIGRSVITNDSQRTRLYIEGSAPILREKDILTAESANTPAKRIYLAVQMMYLSEEIGKFQTEYFELAKDFVQAAPSALPLVTDVSNHILAGSMYKAMKEARNLIEYERKLIAHVQSGRQRLSEDAADDGKSS